MILPSRRGVYFPPFGSGPALWFSWKWYPAVSRKVSFSSSHNPEITMLWKSWSGFLEAERPHAERTPHPSRLACWSVCITESSKSSSRTITPTTKSPVVIVFRPLHWGIVCYKATYNYCALISVLFSFTLPLFFFLYDLNCLVLQCYWHVSVTGVSLGK